MLERLSEKKDLPLDLNFWGLLGEMVSNGRKRVRIFFYLVKHLKTVLGTRKKHRNFTRTFGEGLCTLHVKSLSTTNLKNSKAGWRREGLVFETRK